MKKVGVIAGTPVDTQMGVEYLKKRNLILEKNEVEIEPIYLPLFDNPRQCHIFQMSNEENKYKKNLETFKNGLNQGCENFFIYCNSLSCSFCYDNLASELKTKVVTPLHAYKIIAEKYNKISLIAANGQACAGIEKAFTNANPTCYVLSLGILPLVEAIEKKLKPEEIINDFQLSKLISFFRGNGAETMVLGCTHFPYLKNAIEKLPEVSNVINSSTKKFEILDPADIMYNILQS